MAKKRNPIARVSGKMRTKTIPDKRRKLSEVFEGPQSTLSRAFLDCCAVGATDMCDPAQRVREE